jgi:hypothetical protein
LLPQTSLANNQQVVLLAENRFLGLPWVVGWLCSMPQTGKSVSVKSNASL